MNWLNKIVQIFKVPELRNKILFVLAIFVVFRLMTAIPIPGVDAQSLKDLFERSAMGGFLNILNVFSGGALSNLSIIMLGLGPYITATIVLQLLTMIFPALEKMYKEEGESGRQKFNQWGRMATIPLALLQGYTMLNLLQRAGVVVFTDPLSLITSLVVMTASCMILMWLGELITEKGIGNGVSLLIFAGIVARIPESIWEIRYKWDISQLPAYLLFIAVSLVIVAGVVMVNEARRNIPVSYAKRVRGNKVFGGVSTYLPLNINPAGVIPIIFAISILMLPSMISNFFVEAPGLIGSIAKSTGDFFNNQVVYNGLYFLLVCAFTYFYTAVTFDPKNISSNLQKMGGYVPGIRPGESTAKFIHYILNRVLLLGALFLAIVAVLPSVIAGTMGIQVFSFFVGGTSLLIIVSVVLETMRQIKAQLQMRDYESF
jgi:preprotein translocase subunit SecY